MNMMTTFSSKSEQYGVVTWLASHSHAAC